MPPLEDIYAQDEMSPEDAYDVGAWYLDPIHQQVTVDTSPYNNMVGGVDETTIETNVETDTPSSPIETINADGEIVQVTVDTSTQVQQAGHLDDPDVNYWANGGYDNGYTIGDMG
jgi:hypothetical protein